jgi:hypothetical protein
MDHGWNKVLVLAAVGVGVLAVSTARAPRYVAQEEAFEAPVPVEAWPVDAGATPPVLAVLPKVPGQKMGRCDPDLGEIELFGGCWMETKVPPPCPKGKLYTHEGKCWRPIPRAERTPTSGNRRPGGVAEP